MVCSHRSQNLERAIAKDMFFHGGIVLRDADESLGDVDPCVAEERLCEGQVRDHLYRRG